MEASVSATRVSFVIPVKNDADRLRHCLSTIAVSNGRLFIRTAKNLYAVGKGK